ncbi:unnamed protein product [Soboliphyme baturini]|uniref:Carrier domain-containing protein n=1 Tax=Soboliphyme baturini TaxID=241478 RepID=A0A183ILX8_9BILA|nr:unnamed protein product [Soboliphyme baturini]
MRLPTWMKPENASIPHQLPLKVCQLTAAAISRQFSKRYHIADDQLLLGSDAISISIEVISHLALSVEPGQ